VQRFGSFILACLLAGQMSSQDAVTADWKELRFDNGLSLRLERVPGVKSVGLFVFIQSGFAEDPVKKTGLAHFVEHLVMTGASKERKGWSYPTWVRNRRMGANAMTRADHTVYFSLGTRKEISADARHFASMLAGDMRFQKADVGRERPRMRQEIWNVLQLFPGSILSWRARRSFHPNAANARSGIGKLDQLQAIHIEDLQACYQRTHRPGNAFVIAVGHVDPVRDLPFYKEVFGSLEARPQPALVQIPERSDAKAPPAITKQGNVTAVFGTLAFEAPKPESPEYPAFLCASLHLAKKARLSFRPRGKETQAMFFPGMYAFLEAPELVYFNRMGRKGDKVGEVRKELDRFIDRQLRRGIGRKGLELARLELELLLDPLPRSKFRSARLKRMPRLLYQLGLSRGFVARHPKLADLWERIQALKAEDVNRLLRQSFAKERGRFFALEPKRD